MEWCFRDDDYDFKQEIARSSYADMLHDTERNQLYYAGLKVAVAKKRAAGEPVRVLDIGTGTGLLSMMAASLGADSVHACEAFTPMADCAKKIIAENGFAAQIKVIPKRSTDLVIGEDLPERANILVTEVFDTELIGEGAIGTYTHALRELLVKDCIVVPSVGNMYIQLVSSKLVRRWNQLDDLDIDGKTTVTSPLAMKRCGGAPALHDLQLDQLPLEKFTRLTPPKRVFRFDFTGVTPLLEDETSIVTMEMEGSGPVDGIFMWWDLEMDPNAEIILSCAPNWAHPTPRNMQWRDHWMQAIYYPYTHLTVARGEMVKVICKHDEYSLWFDVAKDKENCPEDRPICTCGAHITYSRSRLGMLSDPDRRQTFLQIIKKNIKQDSNVLCISNGSLLPLMVAAGQGTGLVYALETHPMCARVMRDFIAHNNLQDRVTLIDKQVEDVTEADITDKVDVVLGEPIFQTAQLPWDNICFWYLARALDPYLAPRAAILPGNMRLYAVPVEYEHLWKIRADVGICEGFNLQQFDNIIQLNSESVDETVEPHPLWEYPCTASGPGAMLLNVDMTRALADAQDVEETVALSLLRSEPCNGVALWAEFDFGDGHVISTGPREPIRTGHKITWDYYTRQGVHLLYNSRRINCLQSGDDNCHITVSVKFVPQKGDISFKFSPSWS
ncbi:protein arginine N-methyltransferase 7-like isoform X2 [Mya arenaria]|nr:protein arginine N-methyltransferase 7-like isoform X2 [Mya arenaria]